jgi:hypothetical protein
VRVVTASARGKRIVSPARRTVGCVRPAAMSNVTAAKRVETVHSTAGPARFAVTVRAKAPRIAAPAPTTAARWTWWYARRRTCRRICAAGSATSTRSTAGPARLSGKSVLRAAFSRG